MSFTLRALTPDGLKAAIVKAYRLEARRRCFPPDPLLCAGHTDAAGSADTAHCVADHTHSIVPAAQVKQVSHWITYGPGFFEPIRSSTAFRMLPDPAWVVWSRQPRRGAAAIPLRGDYHLQGASGSGLLQGLTENEVRASCVTLLML